ncbi:GGDEF domain-containing protein [Alteromonas genovensis]|uniref:GGDEF domain-containing protein n=1 Tax=Alteromonas genovensis TaxID=471225 RepID=UPI002FDFF8C3
MNQVEFDHFPCLLLVSHIETTHLLTCNTYAESFLGLQNIEGSFGINNMLSKSSLIFYESYLKPILLSNGMCKEVQLTLLSHTGERVPAVAHITLKEAALYWAIYPAQERDKLYQELVSARENLEAKTEELTRLTRLDPLTSLLNRRALTADLNKIITLIKRKYVPLCFVLIDIDFFKPINDNFGHEYGDEVLIKLAAALKGVVRESDLVARWGGEEFLLVLYNANVDDAFFYCDRIHEAVQDIDLPDNKHLTVSIGIAHVKQEDISDSEVISKNIHVADSALYIAKKSGRNQTQLLR